MLLTSSLINTIIDNAKCTTVLKHELNELNELNELKELKKLKELNELKEQLT